MAPKEYKRRVALFLSWAEDASWTEGIDPMGVQREMWDLGCVLTNRYGFGILTHAIELYKPLAAVREQVRDFIDGYSDPDTLLLLYYGGHGSYTVEDGLLWSASGFVIL